MGFGEEVRRKEDLGEKGGDERNGLGQGLGVSRGLWCDRNGFKRGYSGLFAWLEREK